MNSLKHETNNPKTKLTLVYNFTCEKTIKKTVFSYQAKAEYRRSAIPQYPEMTT